MEGAGETIQADPNNALCCSICFEFSTTRPLMGLSWGSCGIHA